MMAPGLGSWGLGFLAGALSTLSPCVLPLLPILIGSALNTHRHAPLALAAGLVLSYALVGTTLAWASASMGLDPSIFRDLGAAILVLLGLLLLSGALQQRFASLTAGIGDAGNTLLSRIRPDGLQGQFLVGLVLGLVWIPCVGPTLGAAIMLASRGEDLTRAASIMAMFGLGTALPLVCLAYGSRHAMSRIRFRLTLVGKAGQLMLGAIMVALAALILTDADRPMESWLVEHSPDWLTRLTTML